MTKSKNFFRATAEDFEKIPGSPIAYWVGEKSLTVMAEADKLGSYVESRCGMNTSNNDYYLKLWYEISYEKIGLGYEDMTLFLKSDREYVPYNKGGPFRKWFGNLEYVLWLGGKHYEELLNLGNHLPSRQFYFKSCITWSDVTTTSLSFREMPCGSVFDGCAAVAFPEDSIKNSLLGFLNSVYVQKLSHVLNPTIHFKLNDFARLPYIAQIDTGIGKNVTVCCGIAQADWNAYETSWDFKSNPLVAMRQNPVNPVNPVEKTNSDLSGSLANVRQAIETRNVSGASEKSEFQNDDVRGAPALPALYAALREKWAAACEEMRRLEIENNRIFIEAYGLQDELAPDVSWNEITLTCNPWYRYGVRSEVCGVRSAECGVRSAELPRDKTLEERLKSDTVKELVSYAVGCMMGRYSLEKPGLILADQGATIADYWEKVQSEECGVRRETPPSALRPPHSFAPDEDGIIPILDNDWFQNDIVTRFKEFVKVAFGEEHFLENMTWIEDALGKDIRSYFTKDFYKDHLQRYQNRPIYWLFQSPKGAFRALVYMHRYKPDMVGGVLGYLRSLQTKIDNQLDVAMQVGADELKSASERVRANKDAVKFAKAKKELDEYEKNVLYPLSTERIEIDLDDGVKVNYRKFGSALRKVAALEAKGE